MLLIISKKARERTKMNSNPEKYQYSLIVKVVILLITDNHWNKDNSNINR